MTQPTMQEVGRYGFSFPYARGWLTHNLAMDAALISQANATVPAQFLQYISPDVVRVLTAKRAATEIATEKKAGDITTAMYQFRLEEPTGSTAPYSDYAAGATSNVNEQWNNREQYIFQTDISYGDLEVAMNAQAKIDLIASKQRAAAEVIANDANKFYLLGVDGKNITGLLNDPNLPTAIVPNTSGTATTWEAKIAMENGTRAVYNDVLKLFGELAKNSGGQIDNMADLRLLVTPSCAVALNQATDFNVSVCDMLRKNFPNIEVVTVPQLAGDSGNNAILMAKAVMGMETAECAFGEKLRAGRLVPDVSSFRQKFSAGTYGGIVKIPFAFAVMTGV